MHSTEARAFPRIASCTLAPTLDGLREPTGIGKNQPELEADLAAKNSDLDEDDIDGIAMAGQCSDALAAEQLRIESELRESMLPMDDDFDGASSEGHAAEPASNANACGDVEASHGAPIPYPAVAFGAPMEVDRPDIKPFAQAPDMKPFASEVRLILHRLIYSIA